MFGVREMFTPIPDIRNPPFCPSFPQLPFRIIMEILNTCFSKNTLEFNKVQKNDYDFGRHTNLTFSGFLIRAQETYDGKDVCCGKMKKGECDRGKGPTQRITKRNKAGRGLASVNVPGGVCSICERPKQTNWRNG